MLSRASLATRTACIHGIVARRGNGAPTGGNGPPPGGNGPTLRGVRLAALGGSPGAAPCSNAKRPHLPDDPWANFTKTGGDWLDSLPQREPTIPEKVYKLSKVGKRRPGCRPGVYQGPGRCWYAIHI